MFGCHSVVKVNDLLGPDCNSNYDPNYNPEGYSRTSRKIKLPNVVTRILNDAAKENNLSPMPRRSIVASPLALPAQSVQPKGLVERRWDRIQSSNAHRIQSSDELVKSNNFGNEAGTSSFTTSSQSQLQGNVALSTPGPKNLLCNQDKPVVKPIFINEFVNVPGAQKWKQPVPKNINWNGWSVPNSEDSTLLLKRKSHVSLPEPNKCCCERPTRTVWCRMCGFHVKGNVRIICPLHPKMIYLHAWEVCGNKKCRAPRLLVEIDLD